MNLLDLFVLAIGLSMDAFAVSVCKGLATKQLKWKHYVIAGLWFGGFQALMPLIGYWVGSIFAEKVEKVAPYITFILLGLIGANMIKEALGDEEEEDEKAGSFAFMTMLMMAIATSIDALAVGVTFALQPGTNVAFAVIVIGCTTFLLSAVGVRIGNIFGLKYQKKAEIAGGVVLILLGLRFVISHLLGM